MPAASIIASSTPSQAMRVAASAAASLPILPATAPTIMTRSLHRRAADCHGSAPQSRQKSYERTKGRVSRHPPPVTPGAG